MTLPRAQLVSIETTSYYHCISRCVRRAFLCGRDAVTGACFEHRRDWIVARLAELAEVFAIEVCAYSVMSNHHHLVLKLSPERARDWSDDEVLERWCRLFSGPLVVQRHLCGTHLDSGQRAKIAEYAAIYRERLCSLSWFMRCLNEPIARWANAEDNCTGRFWEGRFKSQALLDEKALLSCLAYVDLNPVRAGIARTPEASDFTSIQQRIEESSAGGEVERLDEAVPKLLEFADRRHTDEGLPFRLSDYLELVDWCGRAVHPDKKGRIPDNIPPILARIGIDPAGLLKYLTRKERGFYQVMGTSQSIREAVAQLGRGFLKGVSAANRLFRPIPG